MTIFDIRVYPCSLPDRNECKTLEEITKFSFEFFFILPKLSFKREDFENPVDIAPSVEYTPSFDPSVRKKARIMLKTNKIYEDRSEFGEPKLKKTFVDVDSISENTYPREGVYCKIEDILLGKCTPYYQLEYNSGGRLVKIIRKYTKILDILGSIGGISQSILVACTVVYLLMMKIFLKEVKSERVLGEKPSEILKYFDLRARDNDEEKKKIIEIVKEFDKENYDGFRLIQFMNKFQILDEISFKTIS